MILVCVCTVNGEELLQFSASYLQEARELDHSPAKPGHIGLHQTHLVNIDSQEPLDHATILGDHRARNQVAVVWEEREQNEAQSGFPA